MIHPTVIIDSSAKIADSVEIGPYSIIGADVQIGEGTWIGPHVVIKGPATIGKENKFFQFCSIGEVTQALGQAREDDQLVIGDRNIIREYVTINRGNVTRVGNDNLLMASTHIAHDCRLGNHIIFANAASIAGHVDVGDYAILGGFTIVHQFCKIGTHSFSGLGTIVNRDVAPFTVVAGNHATAYGINKEGLKRRGFNAETLRALHKAYMILLKTGKRRNEALEEVSKLSDKYPEVALMVSFIKASERGVIKSK